RLRQAARHPGAGRRDDQRPARVHGDDRVRRLLRRRRSRGTLRLRLQQQQDPPRGRSMSERFMSRRSARTRASIGTPGPTLALRGIVLLSAGLGLVACPGPSADGGGTGGAPPVGSGGAPLGSGGAPATGGLSSGGTESGGAGGASSGGGGGLTSGGTTGAGGGSGGDANLAPANLSETGLYTERTATGELVLAEGVRECEPQYWLWSDGPDKK